MVFSLLAALCFTLPLSAQTADSGEPGAIWIDLRSPRDFQRGHVDGAVNIPRGEIAHRISELVTDLYAPVHLYDSSAGFAGLALEILMEMGFQYVVNEGSYDSIVARQKVSR